MEYIPIAQKKNGQNRHQKQHPKLLRGFGGSETDPLGEVRQIFAVIVDKTLNAGLRGCTPAMLGTDAGRKLADLARDLAITGFLRESGQCFCKTRALPADSGTSNHKKETHSQQK